MTFRGLLEPYDQASFPVLRVPEVAEVSTSRSR